MRTTVLSGKIGPKFGITIETADHTVERWTTGDKHVDSDRISEALRIMAAQYSYATATVTLADVAKLQEERTDKTFQVKCVEPATGRTKYVDHLTKGEADRIAANMQRRQIVAEVLRTH